MAVLTRPVTGGRVADKNKTIGALVRDWELRWESDLKCPLPQVHLMHISAAQNLATDRPPIHQYLYRHTVL